MRKLLTILLLALPCLLNGQNKQVAITMDDLPFAYAVSLSIEDIEAANRLLLDKLKENKTPATGFINGMQIFKPNEVDQRLSWLEAWLKDGHELGNHLYSHLSFTRSSLQEYEEDFIKNEGILAYLHKGYEKESRYFRHPFLQMGNSLAKKDGFQAFLKEHGYQMAPVTMDNSDYVFNKVYVEAYLLNDKDMMKYAADAYISYLKVMVDYYDKRAIELEGRPIKHIFLFHANLLNAHYWSEVANAIKACGYSFTTLEDALTDPVYQRSDSIAVDGGWNHIDRWSKNDGVKSALTYPEIDEKIMAAYNKKYR